MADDPWRKARPTACPHLCPPRLGASHCTYGIHTLIIVPIHARGRMLGVVTFARTEHPASFEEDNVFLAEELVARAALNLDNANRYTRERDVALALQRTLLPHHLKGSCAVEVASRYLPADHHHGVARGSRTCAMPAPPTRTAAACSSSTGSPTGREPAPPQTAARSCGPNRN